MCKLASVCVGIYRGNNGNNIWSVVGSTNNLSRGISQCNYEDARGWVCVFYSVLNLHNDNCHILYLLIFVNVNIFHIRKSYHVAFCENETSSGHYEF